MAGAVGKVGIPPPLRNFQAEWESPAFGLSTERFFPPLFYPQILIHIRELRGVGVTRLPCLALCLAVGSVIVSAQTNLLIGHVDVAETISRVKNVPVSQIDPAFPPMPFETWLALQIGNDAVISWGVRVPDDPVNGPPLVEADVSIQGRPRIVIMIAEAPRKIRGTKFIFDSLMLMRPGDYAEWPNLGDLPEALKRARGGM